MSPPCIAFFDGDNGGATAKGVTGDEIRIVWVSPCSGGTEDLMVDLDDPVTPNTPGARGIAGLLKHFSERYQFYGRRLHGWYVHFCATRDAQAIAAKIEERIRPFAAVSSSGQGMATALAQRSILVTQSTPSRAFTARYAPFVLSYSPDVEDFAAHVAAFTCARLAGRPAQHSGNLTDRSRTRKFALYYQRISDNERAGGDLIVSAIASRCGDVAGDVAKGVVDGYDAGVHNVARWRTDGVTTVLTTHPVQSHKVAAEGAKWYPEWIELYETYLGAFAARVDPVTEQQSLFALVFDRRLPHTLEDQDWYRAFKEGCPDCQYQYLADFYDYLTMLAWGIQAAGPRLSAHNVDRGLHAIPPYRSSDPFAPAAYFAPGSYSFVKDGMAMRWDPLGRARGRPDGGCWRVVEEGRRYRVEDWATQPGDTDLGVTTWPCQGDPRQ